MRTRLEMQEMQVRMKAEKAAKAAKAAKSASTVLSSKKIMEQFDTRIRKKIIDHDNYEPEIIKKFKEELLDELNNEFDGDPTFCFNIGIGTHNPNLLIYDFCWIEGCASSPDAKLDSNKITRVGMRTYPEMIHKWTHEVINELPCFVSKLKQVTSHMDTAAKYAHFVRITVSEKYLDGVRKDIYGADDINHENSDVKSAEDAQLSPVVMDEDNIVPANPDNKKKPHKKSGKKHHKK